MIDIPFDHEPRQRNSRQVKDSIIALLPKAGDTGKITARDHAQAKLINSFLSNWRSPSLSWKRFDVYPTPYFVLTKLSDTPKLDFSGYVEVPSHVRE